MNGKDLNMQNNLQPEKKDSGKGNIFRKAGKALAKDLWIVILDVIAVNLAYFLALMIRFFVNGEFRPTVRYYLTDFLHFAPFYTILCLLIFAALRLYGGMWRYAGINDMNRIIGASAITAVIHVIGTAVFIRRMPITYYVMGAVMQFLFITLIRFGYRILLVEKKKVTARNTPSVPAMIIGAGETARKAIHHLEDTPFRAAVVVDEKSAGKALDGIPIISDAEQGYAQVRAVFIADPGLSSEKRKAIRAACEEKGLELQDYTGYLSNLAGKVPVTSLLEVIPGPVELEIDGKTRQYASGHEALEHLKDRFEVKSVEATKIVLTRPNTAAYIGYEAWAQQYKEETGEDISFF